MNSNKEFETQFHRRQFISSLFGEIETVDIAPAQLKTGVPVLFAPGWRETPELQKGCLQEVFNVHRRVVALHHARSSYDIEDAGNYPIVEVQKAKTLLHGSSFWLVQNQISIKESFLI